MKLVFRWLTFLLFFGCLTWTMFEYASAIFVVPSAIASASFSLCLLFIGWLILRNHPGLPASGKSSVCKSLLLGFGWGFAMSAPAIFFNSYFSRILEFFQVDWLGAAVYSPLNEETLKLIGVVLICAGFNKLNRAIEAVPVGIAVGLGFAASEAPHFIANFALKDFDSDVFGSFIGVLIRTLACPFGHAVYTGVAAFGVGLFICRSGCHGSILRWWLWAVGLHTLSNAIVVAATEVPIEADADLFLSVLMPLRIILDWLLAVWLYQRSRKIAKRPIGEERLCVQSW